jgi:N-acetyl-beta-hexosaminidase
LRGTLLQPGCFAEVWKIEDKPQFVWRGLTLDPARHSSASKENCPGTRRSIARFPIDPLRGSEYCPGNDKVFEFLEGVFADVAEPIPGPYIQMGGDEAEMRYWAECPKCQERQKKVGNLHAWFMERVRTMVESKARRIIGWGGVAKGTPGC